MDFPALFLQASQKSIVNLYQPFLSNALQCKSISASHCDNTQGHSDSTGYYMIASLSLSLRKV